VIDDDQSSSKTGPDSFNYWLSKISSKVMLMPSPELYPKKAQEFAGRFHKDSVLLPVSGDSFVDMRLNEVPTHMGKRLTKLCRDHFPHVLFTYSGGGKTRAIFDIAMQNENLFLMYIECNTGNEMGKDAVAVTE